MKQLYSIIIFLFCTLIVTAQLPDVANWIERLEDNGPNQVIKHYSIYRDIEKLDSLSRLKAADAIEKETANGNARLQLLGRSVKAKLFFYNTNINDSLYAAQMKHCLNEAVQIDDPWLQAEFGRWYSEMLNTLNQKELAVQYATGSLKLHEYLGVEHFAAVSIFYLWTGETLLQTDYIPESIAYLQKGLQMAKTDTLVRPFRFMFTYNNLGLAYRQLNKFDSAVYYFDMLRNYCVQIKRPDWWEIAYNNRLPCFIELGMLDSAKAVVNRMLQTGMHSSEPDDVLQANEMLGKIAFKEQQYDTALKYLHYSEQLNGGTNKRLLNRLYETLAACYEAMNEPAKAYPYLKFTRHYNDSISRVKQNYNSRYLFIKAEYDKEQMELRRLASNTKKAIRFRNAGIVLLCVTAAVLLWWLNRRRKREQQLYEKASDELDKFKEEVIAKNRRIEELLANIELQHHKQADAYAIEELSKQVILTEADWQHFKDLFEKNYPRFFKTLREKASGITEAEQRMCALIKIELNTKQIAAMQGISPDSVHKTRQRLRQRFGTGSSSELEQIIFEI